MGWTGDAAAASLTIDLVMLGVIYHIIRGVSIPDILFLSRDSLCGFEGVFPPRCCRHSSQRGCGGALESYCAYFRKGLGASKGRGYNASHGRNVDYVTVKTSTSNAQV